MSQELKEQKTAPEEIVEASFQPENIFKGVPAHGTILAKLNEKELKKFRKLSIKYDAVYSAKDVSYDVSAAFHEKWQEFWFEVCEKYNVPYAWPIRIDHFSGALYIHSQK